MPPEAPLVSVVVPFHNDDRFISKCVASVLAQTYPNFEVIVVDDGSRPEAAATARSLAGGRVQYVPREHSGLSSTRNHGVALARGDVVAFIDSDDRWLPHKLEMQMRVLAGFEGVVYSTVVHVDEKGRALGDSDDFDRFSGARHQGSILLPLLARNFVHPSTLVMRKHVFTEVGGFRTGIGPASDWDLALRLAERYPFIRIEEPLVEILRRNDSMGSDPQWLRADSLQVLKDAESRLSSEGRLGAELLAALGHGYFASRNMRMAALTLAKAVALRPWRLDLWRWLGAALLWRPIRSLVAPAWTRR